MIVHKISFISEFVHFRISALCKAINLTDKFGTGFKTILLPSSLMAQLFLCEILTANVESAKPNVCIF